MLLYQNLRQFILYEFILEIKILPSIKYKATYDDILRGANTQYMMLCYFIG